MHMQHTADPYAAASDSCLLALLYTVPVLLLAQIHSTLGPLLFPADCFTHANKELSQLHKS